MELCFFFRWQQIEAKMSRQTPVDMLFVFHDAIGSNLGDAKAKKKGGFGVLIFDEANQMQQNPH